MPFFRQERVGDKLIIETDVPIEIQRVDGVLLRLKLPGVEIVKNEPTWKFSVPVSRRIPGALRTVIGTCERNVPNRS